MLGPLPPLHLEELQNDDTCAGWWRIYYFRILQYTRTIFPVAHRDQRIQLKANDDVRIGLCTILQFAILNFRTCYPQQLGQKIKTVY